MRPRGRCLDGSDSMFRTHQDLVGRAGHAVWFTDLTPAKIEHLGFVNRLLHTFCELDIGCALVNAYHPILQESSVCFRRKVLG